MSTFTWLHISDLHFHASQAYDADVVLRELLQDVAQRFEQDGLRPDLILASGDLAFSGKPDEYTAARHFFDRLLAATGLSKERLFLVPGNHDIDRDLISRGAQSIADSLADRSSVNAILSNPGDRQLMFARFGGYADFVNGYLDGQRPFDDEAYFYVHSLPLAGVQVALLGLNSAWLARGGEGDYGKLALGERQVRTALDRAEDADLKIALLHHPFDWLHDFDRDDCEAMLTDRCDFILHGHLHRTAATQLVSPDGAATVMACGACYETREYPNGYNFVRLDLGAGQGTAFLRTWSDRRGGFWTRDVTSYRNVDNGEYTFRLRRESIVMTNNSVATPSGVTLPGRARIDPDNPPYAQLRKLLKAAFDARSLRRIADEGEFAELRHRFAPMDNIEDLIDELFEFCRTGMLWDELVAFVAENEPAAYNRFAAEWGWPQAPEQRKPSPPTGGAAPTPPAKETRTPKPSPPSPTYDDFEIHVTPGPGDQPLVTVQTALAGNASDPLDRDWTDEEPATWLTQLELGQMDSNALAAIGKQLFRALFHDHVRDSYVEARGATRTRLRLRLWFDVPELQALPWELLYDAGRHEFLALSSKALITRYLSVPQGTPPLAIKPPLRLLVVTASPSDQPNLDVDAEEAAIRAALAPLEAESLVRVESLPHAQVMDLRDALRDHVPHILHFVGHGAMGPEGGALLLEDADGLARLLPADDLRILLQNTPTVRLAVLNACVTARGDADVARLDEQRRAVLGVGPELVRAGLGAVVAMQFPLGDVSAHLFAQDFYRTLARLEPVDLAVARAREALRIEMGRSSRDWATPVLFLRAPDGIIFQT
jgi:3',5'-cyclic AMP phosphodiesterase CpdA